MILQVVVIVIVARLGGALFRRLRQPPVIGEMVAGLALGPSALGFLFPTEHAQFFPASTRPALQTLALAGVMLFMFVVGTRVEVDIFKRHSRAIAAIAAAGIALPFALGAALAVPLYAVFAAPSIPRGPFVLFIATAMSVTAFPVLARILEDRGLEASTVGRTALICAAMNDAVAWGLVASVVGLVSVGPSPVPLGVHGVFVAFVAGLTLAAVAPRAAGLVERLEAPASLVLLPLFFALTGLRTNLLVGAAGSLLWMVAVIAVATVGKFVATAGAAHLAGFSRPDALTMGALMNTRGLMELVVLNIGYDLGLLPAPVFAMMVAMTLVTTLMAGPLVTRWHSTTDRPSTPERQRLWRRKTRTTGGRL